MKKILVIASHPNLESSYANKIILTKLANCGLDLVINHIDSVYLDYEVNLQVEQEKLTQADIIVLQFPFYWYSVPATLKNWIDKVFSFGFAYGSSGDKLKGKQLILSFTVGGPENAYNSTGYNNFTIDELLKPLQQTVYLTQMIWNNPIYTHGCIYIPGVYNTQEEVEERAVNHADKLIKQLNLLLK